MQKVHNTGLFTSDNKPDGIENATHNTFSKKLYILISVAVFGYTVN
jgi:hypothetical protein